MNRSKLPLSLFEKSKRELIEKGYVVEVVIDGEPGVQLTPAGWEYVCKLNQRIGTKP